MARQNERAPSAGATPPRANIGTPAVIPAGPKQRMFFETRYLFERVQLRFPATLTEKSGYVKLASLFFARRRCVLRGNSNQILGNSQQPVAVFACKGTEFVLKSSLKRHAGKIVRRQFLVNSKKRILHSQSTCQTKRL